MISEFWSFLTPTTVASIDEHHIRFHFAIHNIVNGSKALTGFPVEFVLLAYARLNHKPRTEITVRNTSGPLANPMSNNSAGPRRVE